MSTISGPAPVARASLRRAFAYGFLAGVGVTVPLIVLALVSSVGERLLDVLVPATLMLRPLSGVMAHWPGLVNIGLTAVLNGVLYGATGAVLVAIRRSITR